jgi:hypothetical protein
MLQIDESRSGMLGKCKRCGASFRVPGEKRPGSGTLPRQAPVRDKQQPTDKPAPDSTPSPAPAPAQVRKPIGTFSALERVKASIASATPPKTPAPMPAMDQLELVEDDPTLRGPSSRPPGSDPASSSEAVLLEDERNHTSAAAPPGQPRQAITSTPTPAGAPHTMIREEIADVEAVEYEDDDDWDEPRKPDRGTKSASNELTQAPGGIWYVGIAVSVLLWVVLTPLAFFYRPVCYAILFCGIGVSYVGRRWLFRLARQEGTPTWVLMMFVPFYRFFFFFTHVRTALVPFLIWLTGTLLLISGGFTYGFHRFMDNEGKHLMGANSPLQFTPPPPDLSTPEAIDAEAARLLKGNKKEARAWLKEPQNRHDRQARRLIEEAYSNGAKEVYAVGLDDGEETQFVVILPIEPAARKKLFDWHHALEPTLQDSGQKYLLLSTD